MLNVRFSTGAIISLITVVFLTGCSTNQNKTQAQLDAEFLKKYDKPIKTRSKKASDISDACTILKQNPDWHRAAKRTHLTYGISIPVQLAFVRHESSFERKARPLSKKKKLLFFKQYRSTAYGYAQVLNSTWDDFRIAMGNKNLKRTNFGHSVEFIGWYNNKHIKSGLSPNNVSHLYLAYHEGLGGYRNKSYMKKPWLITYSNSVARTSGVYSDQISKCNIDIK